MIYDNYNNNNINNNNINNNNINNNNINNNNINNNNINNNNRLVSITVLGTIIASVHELNLTSLAKPNHYFTNHPLRRCLFMASINWPAASSSLILLASSP
jgi:uncharacterized protein (DUF427 family)